MWGQTLQSSGRSWELVSRVLCGCAGNGVYGKTVCLSLSYLFPFGYLLICLIHRNLQLVFGFLTEGISPRGPVHLVCPWEEGSMGGASYVTIFVGPCMCFNCCILLINGGLYHQIMILPILDRAVSLLPVLLWLVFS